MPARQQGSTVVLVHGLWFSGWCMSLIAWRLRRCGFQTRLFSYPSVRKTLRQNATALRVFSDTVEGGTVHFVGHSLGGVVIQSMLAYNAPPRPGRVVTLGSPHRGSQVARVLSRWSLGKRILGASIADLLRGEPPSCDLSARDIGLIKGDRSLGLGRLVPSLRRPNDGVVALEETHLPGVRDEITLHVFHTGMLFSRRVGTSLCQFLRFGHFVR
jgi:pimeloyl-ACP methyl ester carboxylesterase